MPYQCSNCGSVNADDATFCTNCGSPFSAKASAAVIQVQQKICVSCKRQINVTFSTCPFCGAVQPTTFAESVGIPVQSGSHNKITAGLLGIFLGSFGAHKFYLGQGGMGILYLVFSWTFVPGVVGIIEGITYLTMSDQAFLQKYH